MTNVVSAKLAKGIGPGFSSQVYWFESPKGGIWVVASGEYIGDKAQKFADDYLALQGSLFQNLKISFASFVENIDPSILIGVLAFEDNLVSVTSRGELKALLIRNGQKTIIFSGRDEILTVSGKANIGDTLVFATAQAMQTIVELPYFPKDEAIFKDYSEKIIQEMKQLP